MSLTAHYWVKIKSLVSASTGYPHSGPMFCQHPNSGHVAEKNLLFTEGDSRFELSFVWVLPDDT